MRQNPWKQQPDQLWGWERGEPNSLAFLVGCWGPAPRKCSSVFSSAMEACFQRAGAIMHTTNTSEVFILCVRP